MTIPQFLYLGEEKGTAASTDLAGLAYPGMFDFFGELKRILVSLTDVASLVQHVSSEDGNEESDHMDTDVEEVQVQSYSDSFFGDYEKTLAQFTLGHKPVPGSRNSVLNLCLETQ